MLYGCLGLIARCARRVCDLKGPPPRLNLTGASVCDRQTAPQKAPVTHITPIANELHALATPYAARREMEEDEHMDRKGCEKGKDDGTTTRDRRRERRAETKEVTARKAPKKGAGGDKGHAEQTENGVNSRLDPG